MPADCPPRRNRDEATRLKQAGEVLEALRRFLVDEDEWPPEEVPPAEMTRLHELCQDIAYVKSTTACDMEAGPQADVIVVDRTRLDSLDYRPLPYSFRPDHRPTPGAVADVRHNLRLAVEQADELLDAAGRTTP
jgi:hypothetical protein